MAPFAESIRRIAKNLQSCEEWFEMIRDLSEPIQTEKPPIDLEMRWAKKEDLFMINALEGFVKETDFMETALEKGDRCLILEYEKEIKAFVWVTFRDFRLAPWYTLKLPPDWGYIVYIWVDPETRGKGVGSYLLGLMMKELYNTGVRRLLSGMYSNWDASIRLHRKMGFKIHRRLTQCNLLDIFPLPPKTEVREEG